MPTANFFALAAFLVALLLSVATPCGAVVGAFPFVTYEQMREVALNDSVLAIVQTAASGELLAPMPPVAFTEPAANTSLPRLVIDTSTLFQEILGFGGAITDSAADVFSHLSAANQDAALALYYSPQGLNYTLARLTIGSCDFSVGSYSYDETPGDLNMTHFSIAHDEAQIIPLIRRAQAVAGEALRFFACPWSPPAWMKANNDMRNSKMPGLVQSPEIFRAYALYLSRYVSAYEAAGIPIFALSVQNEPHVARQFLVTYECCGYEASDEAAFLGEYLGPQFASDHPDVRIIIHDDQKTELVAFVATLMADPVAAQFVWGVGVHWYEPFLGGYDAIAQVTQTFPQLTVFITEGTLEARFKQGDAAKQWVQGMYYSRDIVADLANGAAGFVDWNIMLYDEGGPQHALGPCDAPILVDPIGDSFSLQPGFYNIGHFSKFLPVGSRRANSIFSGPATALLAVSFVSVDGAVVVTVVVNPTSDDIALQLEDSRSGRAGVITVPALGLQTVFFSAAPAQSH